MRKFTVTAAALLTVILLCIVPVTVHAQDDVHPDTGYRIIIDDQADLLSDSEEKALAEVMTGIAAYGNVCYISTTESHGSAEKFAADTLHSLFGTESSLLFLNDTAERKLCLWADGEIYKTVTSSYCNTITDNVYRYASREEYYRCAATAFDQSLSLLQGRRIAQPMKHISNGLLALILAILLDFAIVTASRRRWTRSTYGTDSGCIGEVSVTNMTTEYAETTSRYDPVETRSSFSSGGGGSSSGGGHSSGGGGSHSY